MIKTLIRYIRPFFKSFFILFSAILAGYFLLFLVYLIPEERMGKNYESSMEYLSIQKIYPASFDSFMLSLNFKNGITLHNALLNNSGFILDEYTSRIMLEKAVLEEDLPPHLAALSVGGYRRYWHGYLVFLKILLLFFDYPQIKVINIFLMSSLLLVFCSLLYRKKSSDKMILFLTALFLIWPFVLPLSLQYCPLSYLVLIGLIFLPQNKSCYSQYFLLLGICTSYLDLLTFPLVVYGVPMFFILTECENLSVKNNLLLILRLLLNFSFGYLGMWFGKWILAECMLQEKVLADAFNRILFRASSSTGDNADITINAFTSICANLGNYSNFIFLSVFLILLILLFQKWHSNKGYKFIFCMRNVPYLVLMTFPFIWYVLIKNHSYIHGFFTYRNMIIFWLPLFYILQKTYKNPE